MLAEQSASTVGNDALKELKEINMRNNSHRIGLQKALAKTEARAAKDRLKWERATRPQPTPDVDTLRDWRIEGNHIMGPEVQHQQAFLYVHGIDPVAASIVAMVDDSGNANFLHYPKQYADQHRSLIAAAPALLDAAKDAVMMLASPKFQEWIAKHRTDDEFYAMASAMEQRCNTLKKAISQAEKGSPIN